MIVFHFSRIWVYDFGAQNSHWFQSCFMYCPARDFPLTFCSKFVMNDHTNIAYKQEMKMLVMFHGTDMRVGLIMRRKIRRNFFFNLGKT